MKNLVFSLVAALSMLSTTAVFAVEPELNVSPKMHPNLAAAQRLSRQAFDKILAAQKANEWDLEGHAEKAKELLYKANEELKQAAKTANRLK